MQTCGICFEVPADDVGELNNCSHKYCLPCILHWANIESSCPLCKARFTKVSQRPIQLGANTRSRKDLALERLGPVVHVHDIEERQQRVEDTGTPGDIDPLEDAICVICNSPEDEDQTLLCDGCDQAYHTYCVNLSHIPEGTWYCPECSRDWQPPPGTDFGVVIPHSHRPTRRSRRQAHTNHAAILHARQTPSLASLNSPQRDLEAETAAGGVGPNARRRLVRLARARRASREAEASAEAAVIDLITPARGEVGLSDTEEPGPSHMALISPPTTGPAGEALELLRSRRRRRGVQGPSPAAFLEAQDAALAHREADAPASNAHRSVDAIRARYEELRRGADFPAAQLMRPDVPLALPAPQQPPQANEAPPISGPGSSTHDVDQAWRQLYDLSDRTPGNRTPAYRPLRGGNAVPSEEAPEEAEGDDADIRAQLRRSREAGRRAPPASRLGLPGRGPAGSTQQQGRGSRASRQQQQQDGSPARKAARHSHASHPHPPSGPRSVSHTPAVSQAASQHSTDPAHSSHPPTSERRSVGPLQPQEASNFPWSASRPHSYPRMPPQRSHGSHHNHHQEACTSPSASAGGPQLLPGEVMASSAAARAAARSFSLAAHIPGPSSGPMLPNHTWHNPWIPDTPFPPPQTSLVGQNLANPSPVPAELHGPWQNPAASHPSQSQGPRPRPAGHWQNPQVSQQPHSLASHGRQVVSEQLSQGRAQQSDVAFDSWHSQASHGHAHRAAASLAQQSSLPSQARPCNSAPRQASAAGSKKEASSCQAPRRRNGPGVSPSSADSTTTSNVEAHSRAEPQRSGSHGRPQSSWQQTPRTAADALEPDPEKRKAELTKQVKAVLKRLKPIGSISKDSFRQVAKNAVHALCNESSTDVGDAVRQALQSLGIQS